MFCVTRGRAEESAAALSLVHGLERELFTALGLAFRVLDMCAEELGDPASEKYDIGEAVALSSLIHPAAVYPQRRGCRGAACGAR